MQLDLFNQDLVDKIRKQVLKEFKQVDGEDGDEFKEFIRYEVDSRLADVVRHNFSYKLQKNNNKLK